MKSRNAYTPLKALQIVYDRAMASMMDIDSKTEAALEKVRLHYGLKVFPR
jgi:hypothetical protein